jgi:hypothetical protein
VRLRRQSGSAGRPLNFTVRAHAQDWGIEDGIGSGKEASAKALFDASAVCALLAQSVVSIEV